MKSSFSVKLTYTEGTVTNMRTEIQYNILNFNFLNKCVNCVIFSLAVIENFVFATKTTLV